MHVKLDPNNYLVPDRAKLSRENKKKKRERHGKQCFFERINKQ